LKTIGQYTDFIVFNNITLHLMWRIRNKDTAAGTTLGIPCPAPGFPRRKPADQASNLPDILIYRINKITGFIYLSGY
jgi:hypothetical protein